MKQITLDRENIELCKTMTLDPERDRSMRGEVLSTWMDGKPAWTNGYLLCLGDKPFEGQPSDCDPESINAEARQIMEQVRAQTKVAVFPIGTLNNTTTTTLVFVDATEQVGVCMQPRYFGYLRQSFGEITFLAGGYNKPVEVRRGDECVAVVMPMVSAAYEDQVWTEFEVHLQPPEVKHRNALAKLIRNLKDDIQSAEEGLDDLRVQLRKAKAEYAELENTKEP